MYFARMGEGSIKARTSLLQKSVHIRQICWHKIKNIYSVVRTLLRIEEFSLWKSLGITMVRRGSVWCGVAQNGAAWLRMVRRGSEWCGVDQNGAAWPRYGAAWLIMVRRGSVGSASACCKAGPSSILGSAPQGGVSTLSIQAMRKWREASANGEG